MKLFHHTIFAAATLLFLLPIMARGGEKRSNLRVSLTPDKPGAIYACGETATLRIDVRDGDAAVGEGEVRIVLLNDFRDALEEKSVPLGKEGASVSIKRETPGFVTCKAAYQPKEGKAAHGLASVGFDPRKIEPALPEPEDFDAFWKRAREERDKIPPDAKFIPLTDWKNNIADGFKISVANIHDTRSWGFLAIPKDAKGPLPLMVNVPGANLRAPQGPQFNPAFPKAMQLVVSVHPHDPNLPKKELDAIAKGPWYARLGAPDRDACYWKRAILGVDRVIETVCTTQPWDKKHCVMHGGSQGGAFALFMSGFCPRVTACASEKPALCDHAGYTVGRGTGWPNLASYQEEPIQDATLAMSGYFDAVFFARRIRVPTVMSVGFVDQTCPPSGVYAAFNQIESPKRIFDEPRRGHAFGKNEYAAFLNKEWFPGQLGLAAPVPPTIQE